MGPLSAKKCYLSSDLSTKAMKMMSVVDRIPFSKAKNYLIRDETAQEIPKQSRKTKTR